MIEKLNLEQLGMVSGGSFYCIFRDDKVLVCYTDFTNPHESPLCVLYDNWEEASADASHYDIRGIESFLPVAFTKEFMIERAKLEEFE